MLFKDCVSEEYAILMLLCWNIRPGSVIEKTTISSWINSVSPQESLNLWIKASMDSSLSPPRNSPHSKLLSGTRAVCIYGGGANYSIN